MEALICLPVILLLSLGVGQFAHIWYCRQIVQYASFVAARATLPLSEEEVRPGMSEEAAGAFYAARQICALVSFSESEGTQRYQRNWLKTLSSSMVDSEGRLGGSGGLDGVPQPVQFPVERGGGTVSLPGWRAGKLAVAMELPNQWTRAVTVRMDVPLLFPFAGQVIGKVMRIWNDGDFDFGTPDEGPDDTVITHEYDEEFRNNFFFPHIRLHETSVIGKPFHVTTTGNLPAGYEKWGE